MSNLVVDWRPSYELVLSLAVFLDRQHWKTLDLGPSWGFSVERRLGPAVLTRLKEVKEPRTLHVLFPLIAQAPVCEAEAFLSWLASLTPGELYASLHPHLDEIGSQLPQDLVAWRDRLVAALTLWNEQYFRDLDPAVLAHLEAEATSRRKRADQMPALQVILEATNGLDLTGEAIGRVLLVPQFHMSPWNVGSALSSMEIILYPAEMPQATPDDPPLSLIRLTRALADENRLRILRFLGQEPLSLGELTARTGLAKSTVHHHMVALRTAGLVTVRARESDGRYTLQPASFTHLADQFRDFILTGPKEVE